MPDTQQDMIEAPFLRAGPGVRAMVLYMLGALGVLAVLHSVFYDAAFVLRWSAFVCIGLGLELAYFLLATGRFRLRSGSSAVTAALLAMSIPTTTPMLPVVFALILAVIVVRMPSEDKELNLNPMLVGRLFLMIAFGGRITNWTARGIDPEAVSTATPLELFHSEEAVYSLKRLLAGRIGGDWEGLYTLVPGGPGEMFGVVILILGVFLWRKGILAWRPGVAFVGSFAVTCGILREPVLFNVLAGSVIFAAVFIASDPKTSPISRSGQWIFGCVAGVTNLLVRKYTFYSEGIVFAFLLAGLLSPTLDRIAFRVRGYRLLRQKRALGVRLAASAPTPAES